MQRWLAVFVLVLLGACGPLRSTGEPGPTAAAAPPVDTSTPERFTESVRARFAASLPGATVRVTAPLTLVIRSADGQEVQVNLDNLYRDCNRPESDCAADVTTFIAMTRRSLGPAEPATRDQLLAAVRPREYVEAIGQQSASALVEPFAGDLYVVLVIDLPESARLAHDGDLTALGLDRAQAFAVARQNVARELGNVAALLVDAQVGSGGSLARGHFYEASVLLQVEAWASLVARWQAPVHVSVPARDVVLFVIGDDDDLLGKLRTITAEVYAGASRPLSPLVYRFTGQGWAPLPGR